MVRSPQPPPRPPEEIQFTVYRPNVLRPGEWKTMLAFMHLAHRRPDAPRGEPSPVEQVQALARQALGKQASQYDHNRAEAHSSVPRESDITLVPVVPGLEFLSGSTVTFDDVFVMDADGSDLRQGTADEADLWSGQPTWSPDGKELAYVRGESVASTVSSKYGELYRIDLDGDAMRPLTTGWPDTDPDWSPDGRAIAFVRGENLSSFTKANDDLYVLEIDTGQVRRLTTTPAGTFENAPAWAPDGSRIAFVRTPRGSQFSGRASLHVIDRDGSREQRLLRYELFADAPYSLAWSPDGRSLAFETSSAIGCTSISVLDLETRSQRAVTSCARPREATVAPTWQPAPEQAD